MDLNLESLATLIAAVAAVAAWRAAVAASNAVRTQIMLEFSIRDAQKEFGEATEILWAFKQKCKIDNKEIALQFEKLKSGSLDEWKNIDNARRIVHKFWLQLMSVKLAGFITDQELIVFFYKPQLETIVEILEPLESKKPGFGYSKPIFDEYRKLYDNYDEYYKKRFGCFPNCKKNHNLTSH